MATVKPADFKAQLAAAGITPEKPLYGVLMTVMQAAGAAQEAVKGGARGLSPEGERALIQRAVDTMGEGAERHIDRLAWRIGFWNTAKLALLGVMLCVAGYSVGRYQAEAGQAAALEGAAFVAQLAALNDAAALRTYCQGHSSPQNGGTVCQLPSIWIKRQRD